MTRSHVTSTRRRGRRGFTLPELMVATVMLAIIGAALMSMLVKQQRFYRGTGDVMDLRAQLRQASQAITADLRGISSVGGDIIAMSDSSIDFRQTFGSGIVCKIPTKGGKSLVLAPQTLSSGAVLTTWLTTPTAGSDSIMIFDEGTSTANSDDTWQTFQVAGDTAKSNACPTGSGYFTATGETNTSYTIATSGSLDTSITVGSPVRFYHYAHYSLYKASDSKWYLGFCQPACSSTNKITAVAGPFRAYTAAGGTDTSGIRLTYYDSTGAVTATKANVARIGIVIRGATQNPVNISGFKSATKYDSLSTMVAVRNRS